MTNEESPEEMSKVLDIIHDLAAKAGTVEGIPPEVDEALDQTIRFCCAHPTSW